ncbi:MAG: hypothetical protein ACTSWY_09260 [Promethearchaeota archaeon]
MGFEVKGESGAIAFFILEGKIRILRIVFIFERNNANNKIINLFKENVNDFFNSLLGSLKKLITNNFDYTIVDILQIEIPTPLKRIMDDLCPFGINASQDYDLGYNPSYLGYAKDMEMIQTSGIHDLCKQQIRQITNSVSNNSFYDSFKEYIPIEKSFKRFYKRISDSDAEFPNNYVQHNKFSYKFKNGKKIKNLGRLFFDEKNSIMVFDVKKTGNESIELTIQPQDLKWMLLGSQKRNLIKIESNPISLSSITKRSEYSGFLENYQYSDKKNCEMIEMRLKITGLK